MATPEANQSFLYQPLDTRGFPIRVLQVLPGDIADPLSCTLGNYADAAEEGWTCLSYAWGNEAPSRAITINGSPFLVRSNVYDFLQEARRRCLVNLWIDSICICQTDIDERSSQVALMTTIFGDAKLVMVWLGLTLPALECAFRLLDSCFPSAATPVSLASSKDACCQLSSTECDALFESCSAAIWTRQWVKQEILMPKTAILCCGQASVNMSVYLAIMDSLFDYCTLHDHGMPSSPLQEGESEVCAWSHTEFNQLSRQCANVLALNASRRFKANKLPVLIEMFKGSVCTDFHDYVYAFRGLMDQGSSLRVDYKLPSAQIFLDTLDFVAKTTHATLPGSNAAERHFLANIYKGLGMTSPDLGNIFASYHTCFLVQIGYSLEILRKDTCLWVFVDSITDVEEFVSSSWREKELHRECGIRTLDNKELGEYCTVLNQLRVDSDINERPAWLYGLRSWCGPNLGGLRAIYEPDVFYGCSSEYADLLDRLESHDCRLLAMSLDPCGQKDKLLDWLSEVKDQMVLTVTDRDDAALQMQVTITSSCEVEDCLLARRSA